MRRAVAEVRMAGGGEAVADIVSPFLFGRCGSRDGASAP